MTSAEHDCAGAMPQEEEEEEEEEAEEEEEEGRTEKLSRRERCNGRNTLAFGITGPKTHCCCA